MSTVFSENDLSEEIVAKIREEYEKSPYYLQLTREKEKCINIARKPSTAPKTRLKLLSKVESIDTSLGVLWEVAKREYFNSLPPATQAAAESMRSMNKEDSIEFRKKVNALAFLTDILETLVTDCNGILGKYEDSKIVMFDDLINVTRALRDAMRLIHGRESDKMAGVFADHADEITDLVLGRIDSFLKDYEKAEKESSHEQE